MAAISQVSFAGHSAKQHTTAKCVEMHFHSPKIAKMPISGRSTRRRNMTNSQPTKQKHSRAM